MSKNTAEPDTALVAIEQIKAPAIFGEGEFQGLLDYISAQVEDTPTDATTQKNRRAMKSAAYKVTRSKTLIEDVGKEYAADLKQKIKNIDANRRSIRDALDALRDRLRKPADDFEAAEAARAAEIEHEINKITAAGQKTEGSSAALSDELQAVKAIEITEAAFGDRQGDAAIAKDIAVSNLERAVRAAQKREQDEEELARLRKREAEEADRRRIQEAQQRARDEAAAAVEHEKREAVLRAERAEREAKEAREAQARAEAEAERKAQERAEQRERERQREQARKREEDERRAADIEHRRKINAAAVAALTEEAMIGEEQARDVITVIAAGRIPQVSIRY